MDRHPPLAKPVRIEDGLPLDTAIGLTLADLRPGASVTVSRIDGDRRAKRDLADLGVRVGGDLTVIRRLAGGAVAVRHGGMTVAIGGTLARRVMAAPV